MAEISFSLLVTPSPIYEDKIFFVTLKTNLHENRGENNRSGIEENEFSLGFREEKKRFEILFNN